MFIDLLLLLRTQRAAPAESSEQPRPIVYTLLELLCAVLVDSPTNARTFEKLSGLEAVTRVLKGTGVAKDVRYGFCTVGCVPCERDPADTLSG
jgi:hypothetical protein